MDIDAEAARRLLRESPPAYDGFEQLEVEGQEPASNWLRSLKSFRPRQITRSLSRVVDPVAHRWRALCRRVEDRVSENANIMVVKRILFLLVVGVLVTAFYFMYWNDGQALHDLKDHMRLKSYINNEISAERLQETTEFLAKMPHYAGSQADTTAAHFVHDMFLSYGIGAAYDKHDTFLSHGNTTLCELYRGDELVFRSNLTEGTALDTNEISQQQPPTQMSLVLPGEAEGPLVYANFGSDSDFASLDVKKAIVLVKLGDEPPGSIAMRAQDRGAAGVLFMASKQDPDEDSWPHGRDYPYDSIPQGSLGWPVDFPGDILSPGWPSSDQMELDLSSAYIAKIPAAAISWNDAAVLLNSLVGHGRAVQDWGNNGAPDRVAEWWTGPSPETRLKLVTNPIAEKRHQIQNVFGELKGQDEPEKFLVIGARIDTMCYGTTQLAGLNIILEVARVLSNLRRTEYWEPLRSIFFVLWDGTAHNYAGSTEWVEGVSRSLTSNGIAYIDLDVGISGGELQVRGNPVFDINSTLDTVHLGDHSLRERLSSTGQTPIQGFGNYLAFEAHTMVPSLQLGFVDPGRPVPLDSCYDNIEWMHKFGDPNWDRHKALAQLVANLAIDIADGPLLPFNFKQLGEAMTAHAWYIKRRADEVFGPDFFVKDVREAFDRFLNAIATLRDSGAIYEDAKANWNQYMDLHRDKNTGNLQEVLPVTHMRHLWNHLVSIAMNIGDINGIKRNWYKNHYLGPRRNQTVADPLSGVFPGIQDAIDSSDRKQFLESVKDVTVRLVIASEPLREMIY